MGRETQTRRNFLLYAGVGLATLGTGLSGKMLYDTATEPIIYEPLPTPDTDTPTPEGTPISRIKQELVKKYQDRFAVFGNTSHVDALVVSDQNIRDIELPRQMIKGALDSLDAKTAPGYKLKGYGEFKNFVERFYSSQDEHTEQALSFFNPYFYLPKGLYHADFAATQKTLRNPDELFAATMATLINFPEGLIDQYNSLPMQPDTGDHGEPSSAHLAPSWEKTLTHMTVESSITFAHALLRTTADEGDGTVSQRLATVVPKASIVNYTMSE